MPFAKKPSRADLLDVIAHLQDLIGRAKGAAHNDRSPNRMAEIVSPLERGFDLCVDATSFDPPRKSKQMTPEPTSRLA
jgi:hypothetical protein